MQQLTGLDNLFLCIDAGPATNAVIGDLLLYEPSGDPAAGGLEQVRARLAERVPAIPPLRRAMSGLPVGINNQYLREVDVEIAAHVREVVLPSPGDLASLAAGVAEAMEAPLAAHRPLWELVVFRGLPDGAVAHLLRIHHGIVDGPTLPIVVDLLSDRPTLSVPDSATASSGRTGVPEFVELLARGVVNSALAPARLVSMSGRTLQYLVGRAKHEGALALPAYLARMLPGGMSKPLSALVNGHQRMIGGAPVRPLIPAISIQKTPFNGKLTERRSYVFTELPMAPISAAARQLSASPNDLVVAACAGAMRRYMQRYGEVPDRPLILCVPTSIRTGKEKEPWATHLGMLFAEFPTNVDDPVARLTLVRDDLAAARATFEALPMHMLRDASRLLPVTLLNVSMKLLNRAPDWAPGTPWNVVVSQVKVRPDAMTVDGLRVRRQWPVGFLTPGMGLNIGVHAHPDRLDVTFCGCPDLMPDLEILASLTRQAVQELVEAAQAVPSKAKPATPRLARARSAPRDRTSLPDQPTSPARTTTAARPRRAAPTRVSPTPAAPVPADDRPRVALATAPSKGSTRGARSSAGRQGQSQAGLDRATEPDPPAAKVRVRRAAATKAPTRAKKPTAPRVGAESPRAAAPKADT